MTGFLQQHSAAAIQTAATLPSALAPSFLRIHFLFLVRGIIPASQYRLLSSLVDDRSRDVSGVRRVSERIRRKPNINHHRSGLVCDSMWRGEEGSCGWRGGEGRARVGEGRGGLGWSDVEPHSSMCVAATVHRTITRHPRISWKKVFAKTLSLSLSLSLPLSLSRSHSHAHLYTNTQVVHRPYTQNSVAKILPSPDKRQHRASSIRLNKRLSSSSPSPSLRPTPPCYSLALGRSCPSTCSAVDTCVFIGASTAM